MNTRSKTEELIQNGEMCENCYGPIDPTFYATWCQCNTQICHKCFTPDQCIECKTEIPIVVKVYVLDGTPECLPICVNCAMNHYGWKIEDYNNKE